MFEFEREFEVSRVRQLERGDFESLRVREFDRLSFTVQQFESLRVRQVERV